jgi:RNA polymerase sigma-70 factor (ECF subfamily)
MQEPDLDTTDLHLYLDRMRQGDAGARDELLQRIQRRLERLCHKMLGSYPEVRRLEETADVFQVAVMRLLKSLDELRPESTRSFYNLAAEQLRRTLLDLAKYYRRARRQAGLQVPLAPRQGDDSAAAPDPVSPDEPPDELARWEAFHEAVFELPALERETFNLVFYGGWPQAEVARLFQVSERQVRRRWHSACIKLAKVIGKDIV